MNTAALASESVGDNIVVLNFRVSAEWKAKMQEAVQHIRKTDPRAWNYTLSDLIREGILNFIILEMANDTEATKKSRQAWGNWVREQREFSSGRLVAIEDGQ